MIISVQCPACHTSFPVDPRKVPDGGVKVRCSACSGIFFVEKPEMPPPAAPVPPAPEPAVDAGTTVSETAGDAAGDRAGAAPAAPADPAPPAEEPVPDMVDEAPTVEEPDGPASADDDNVDPWSGADWDDPADMGAPHGDEPADPWSGGMGLDEGQAEASASPRRDWVIERADEDPLAAQAGEVERVGTVEEQVRSAAEEWDAQSEEASDWDDPEAGWNESEVPPAAEAPVDEGSAASEPDPAPAPEPAVRDEAADAVAEAVEEAAAHAPDVEVAPPEPSEAPAARPTGFQFGKRDPHDKAKRLARVLVSDIITYNPERHQRALEQDTLHADFEEEIKKSWTEYVEQVGRDIAESTPYWFDALNEILARGRKVF